MPHQPSDSIPALPHCPPISPPLSDCFYQFSWLPDKRRSAEIQITFLIILYNKNNKKPLAMSFIPTAKGLVYNMDLFVAQPPVNHSLTIKPPDYKNNGSYATVINLLSKDF